ncbi:hypothetical protein ACCO45_009203 [Purpureocillium lilacinum]|uniref:Uncharacterized protein n=1 Tax=Purpureocillium lilacinum TaxID=33203 RepID=A0ACC4DKK2_PURLI
MPAQRDDSVADESYQSARGGGGVTFKQDGYSKIRPSSCPLSPRVVGYPASLRGPGGVVLVPDAYSRCCKRLGALRLRQIHSNRRRARHHGARKSVPGRRDGSSYLDAAGLQGYPPLALVHRKCATVHARESPLGLRLPIHAPSSGLRGVRRQRRCVTRVTTKWLLWTNLPGLMARVGDDARPPHALKVHNGLLKTDTDSKHPRMNRLIISSPQTPEALRPQTYAPTDPCPVTLVWALSRCSIHCSDQGHHQTSNTTVLGNPRISATPSGDLRGRDG